MNGEQRKRRRPLQTFAVTQLLTKRNLSRSDQNLTTERRARWRTEETVTNEKSLLLLLPRRPGSCSLEIRRFRRRHTITRGATEEETGETGTT